MDDKYLEIFKALSDATRHDILEHLLKVEELSVNDLCEVFEHLAQPTVSHHLQILRRSDIVRADRRGKMVYYSVRRAVIRGYFEDYMTQFE